MNVSFALNGGISLVVKFALPMHYIANRWIFFAYLKRPVSLNIGNFHDVVCTNNEATNGTVYTPTGVCGEAFILLYSFRRKAYLQHTHLYVLFFHLDA
jgi:hypothetical protein